ncbi:hypothetical protein, partial [Aquabacterium sp.]|uniref:hypothetical protein n=1 Tax=Aquabacterium sp. TaxID=1872578 RepID=UPI0025C0C595
HRGLPGTNVPVLGQGVQQVGSPVFGSRSRKNDLENPTSISTLAHIFIGGVPSCAGRSTP